jgi:hypothetical protein
MFFSYDIIEKNAVLDIANEKLLNRLEGNETEDSIDIIQNSLKKNSF